MPQSQKRTKDPHGMDLAGLPPAAKSAGTFVGLAALEPTPCKYGLGGI